MNLNVFTFFYRGFNRSKGKPSELTLKFDLEAVKHHLRLRNKQMIVYGQSLGTGSALYYGNLYKMSPFIILENPFSKLINHSNNILKRALIFFTCIDRWDNIKEIEKLNSQILFLVSTKDKVVISKNHEILVKSHNKGENKIIKFEGVGHFNARKAPDFKPTIENFINGIKNK
ncbi:BAAT/cyl-CoA thioester hydrolase protein [Spraguea lophii 42_110]|uniref:BAAT/cyl-CoA thioester hydrolase protein n=1 Tax=Spraguea lophii (strain 42_110) TaxID=1358809 RepID=S7WAX6_SPRLO|nr:BAAT/cyl-CoA thioester hydrolase protein [Spraguea lophii 42_110]